MSTTEINDQLQVRRDKMEDLRQNGIDPFGQRFDRTHLSSELVEEFGAFSKSLDVSVQNAEKGKLVLLISKTLKVKFKFMYAKMQLGKKLIISSQKLT